MIQLKQCTNHGITEFSANDGKRLRCRKCQVEAVKRRRRKVKRMAVDFKGGKCIRCGYSKCVDALEFHHSDPTEKEFTISSNKHVVAWDRLKKELEKCDLLCANCHAEIHSNTEV